MGLRWQCFLDDLEVEEPTNLADIELSIIRDDQSHGIGFQASNSPLNFIGNGADYLEMKKNSKGLKASIVFKALQNCSDDSGEFETAIEGKVNIGQYNKACGDECSISVPIESVSCETVLNNRFTQQVDVDKAMSFGGIALPQYFGLGLNMELPTRELDYETFGTVSDAGDVEPIVFPDPGTTGAGVYVRPEFSNELGANINSSNLTGGTNTGITADSIYIPISPEVLFDEPNVKCFPGKEITITGRLKGTITMPGVSGMQMYGRLLIGEPDPQLPFFDAQMVELITLGTFTNPNNQTFDWTIAPYTWIPKDNGKDGAYLYIILDQHNGMVFNGNITFDKESFFKAETTKACPPSNTQAYLVHETLSRVTEAVTDYCVRVKSSYYGRTDSQPFDFPSDGCGGLRFLTTGLKIRNALNPTFFASPQDLIVGLRAIDNIGWGIEDDPDRPGALLLRIEDMDYFYQDLEIMRCPFISKGNETVDESKSFATIRVGYKKWETQANFGLDEFNSNREYRTAITSVSNILDITSTLIAGSYPFELTREQQYVDTSNADTTYDNEIFIACLKRVEASGYPYGELIVEQGNIADPSNIFSPGSVYNYGISPLRNLMRWFRTIVACYPNLTDADNKLYFNAGTGNLLAKGELSAIYGGTCRLEDVPIQENQDLSIAMFIDQAKATPLWRNEGFAYEYPMSLKDYNYIKANPYGYISYQCGNGEWKKGFIKEVDYKLVQGMATFTLKKKW